jgi:pimeloyl-ACP methyl ester carboxylesterase
VTDRDYLTSSLPDQPSAGSLQTSGTLDTAENARVMAVSPDAGRACYESAVVPAPRVEGSIWLRQGRSIGFAEYGAALGRPVLWFHGTPGGCRQVPPAARIVAAERDVRLIALERPGVGSSTRHVYRSILGWADDVEEVANHLGLPRFAMIGLSGGGPYVLACAYRLGHRVVAGAVLGGVAPARGDEGIRGGLMDVAVALAPVVEAACEPLGHLLWRLNRSLMPISSQAFDAFVRFMPAGDQAVYGRPEMKSMFLDDLDHVSRRQLHGPLYDILQFTRPWGFSLREVRVPIRFWHGDADPIVPLAHAEHMAALVPDAALRVRAREGHIGNLDAAREVLEVILDLWSAAPEGHGLEPSATGAAGAAATDGACRDVRGDRDAGVGRRVESPDSGASGRSPQRLR